MMSVRRHQELKPGGIDGEEGSQTNLCTRSNLSDCGQRSVHRKRNRNSVVHDAQYLPPIHALGQT